MVRHQALVGQFAHGGEPAQRKLPHVPEAAIRKGHENKRRSGGLCGKDECTPVGAYGYALRKRTDLHFSQNARLARIAHVDRTKHGAGIQVTEHPVAFLALHMGLGYENRVAVRRGGNRIDRIDDGVGHLNRRDFRRSGKRQGDDRQLVRSTRLLGESGGCQQRARKRPSQNNPMHGWLRHEKTRIADRVMETA